MLLEFTVGNFLSFDSPQTLSMEATRITEHTESVFIECGRKILKSAVLYGANSSGKSNYFDALGRMKQLIGESASQASTDSLNMDPFLLKLGSKDNPSHFQIVFIVTGKMYRYGFEACNEKIHNEWLYVTVDDQEEELFLREDQVIEVSEHFGEGAGLESKTRPNALFLSVCDQFNGEISGTLIKYFGRQLGVISGLGHTYLRKFLMTFMDKEEYSDLRQQLMKFIENLDLGFTGLRLEESPFDPSVLLEHLSEKAISEIDLESLKDKRLGKLHSRHNVYDEAGNSVGEIEFSVQEQESAGTNKILDLIGPIFNTLINGDVLIVDELDAKLHPILTRALVKLFNSNKFNPYNAQLIFATHDTNLLHYGDFRRDQIYFVEKNRQEASELYSLIEYREEDGGKVRKDRSFEKDYIQGRYGAIPYIGDFNSLFEDGQ